jgi:hypothetical protein
MKASSLNLPSMAVAWLKRHAIELDAPVSALDTEPTSATGTPRDKKGPVDSDPLLGRKMRGAEPARTSTPPKKESVTPGATVQRDSEE